MDVRLQRNSNVTGSIGHQPVRSATPAISAMRPAFCGGMMLATVGLYLSKSVDEGLARDIDRCDQRRHPTADLFKHAGIKRLPCVLELALHGEGIFGVEHDDL